MSQWRWKRTAGGLCAGVALVALVLWAANRPDLTPVTVLRGSGVNIDSLAFWAGEDPESPWLFVTAQDNHRVEVWRFPFESGERPPLVLGEGLTVNGVAVDPRTNRLYVTSGVEGSGRFEVNVYSLPELAPLHRFGLGILGEGETNLAILHRPDGETLVFATDDHTVHAFRDDGDGATWVAALTPRVSEIETVLADDLTQRVYVPDERGDKGSRPGVHVFDAEGRPQPREGENVFAADGHFEADAEGIALYRCVGEAGVDSGRGLIVLSDQRPWATDLEFFDRQTWRHVGTLTVAGVANTDGIAVLEAPLPGHPLGLLAAVHDDRHTAIVDWVEIFAALGVDCEGLGES